MIKLLTALCMLAQLCIAQGSVTNAEPAVLTAMTSSNIAVSAESTDLSIVDDTILPTPVSTATTSNARTTDAILGSISTILESIVSSTVASMSLVSSATSLPITESVDTGTSSLVSSSDLVLTESTTVAGASTLAVNTLAAGTSNQITATGVNITPTASLIPAATALPDDFPDIVMDDEEKDFVLPELSAEDSAIHNGLEVAYHAYQSSDDPVQGDAPAPVPTCGTSAAKRDRLSVRAPAAPVICAVGSIRVNVYTHSLGFVKYTTYGITEGMVDAQIRMLNDVYNRHKIYFTRVGTVHDVINNKLSSPHDRAKDADIKAKQSSRQGALRDLNIWFTGLIYSESPKAGVPSTYINGYSTLPWSGSSTDGVVADRRNLPGYPSPQSNNGKTIIHEVGHWLGLNHTHARLPGYDCAKISGMSSTSISRTLDDGLSDTPLGVSSDVVDATGTQPAFQCMQPVCYSGSGANPGQTYINNWMSYSTCRGQVSETDTTLSRAAITTQQRARMFAAFTFWRVVFRKISKEGCPDVRNQLAKRQDPISISDALAFDLNGVSGSLGNQETLCVSNQSFVSVPPTYAIAESEQPQAGASVSGGGGSGDGSAGSNEASSWDSASWHVYLAMFGVGLSFVAGTVFL